MEQRKITIDLISEKDFQIVSRGYDQREVDEFLDDICDEMERMENRIKELQQQNAVVRAAAPVVPAAPVAEVRTGDEDGNQRILAMLELAARLKDETIAKAEEEAEVIRSRARTEASERIGDLSEEKAKLLREIENLKKVAEDYRKNFEALLQAQQEAIEKATEIF